MAGQIYFPVVVAYDQKIKQNGTQNVEGRRFMNLIGTNVWNVVDNQGALATDVGLNVGSGNNQIVQLNSTGQLPAVDGSLLTGISAGISAGRSYFSHGS